MKDHVIEALMGNHHAEFVHAREVHSQDIAWLVILIKDGFLLDLVRFG